MPELSVSAYARARLQLSARCRAIFSSSAFCLACCSPSAFLRRASSSGSTLALATVSTAGALAAGVNCAAERCTTRLGFCSTSRSGMSRGGGVSLTTTWPRESFHFHCAAAGSVATHRLNPTQNKTCKRIAHSNIPATATGAAQCSGTPLAARRAPLAAGCGRVGNTAQVDPYNSLLRPERFSCAFSAKRSPSTTCCWCRRFHRCCRATRI